MSDLSLLNYRTARNLRVVPYNRVSAHVGSELPPADEFCEGGYGYALLDPEQISNTSDNAEQTADERQLIELDQESALLLLTLLQPGPLPGYLDVTAKQEERRGLLNLIYQGLIEVEMEGEYHSREDAALKLQTNSKVKNIHDARDPSINELSAVAKLSIQALQNADRFELRTADQLFRYLYQYQPIPIGPKRRQELENEDAFLNIQAVSKQWVYSDKLEGWHYFSPHGKQSESYMGKLYISPTLSDLAETVAIASKVLAGFKHVSFKVGSGCTGLQRPDKIVAYFSSLDSLMKAAEKLQNEMPHIAAHGVPFTSSYSKNGLISWGIDPRQEQGERQSWRQWLIEKIVSSMLCTSTQEIRPGRWELALAQLELDGINPNTFRPGGTWITEYS